MVKHTNLNLSLPKPKTKMMKTHYSSQPSLITVVGKLQLEPHPDRAVKGHTAVKENKTDLLRV